MTTWILKGIYEQFGVRPIYNVVSQNNRRMKYFIKNDDGTIR